MAGNANADKEIAGKPQISQGFSLKSFLKNGGTKDIAA
jgi:hypothetical protein